MRAGLTAPLWRRLSCTAPCHCASPCYGSMLRTLKFNDQHLWHRQLNSTLLLPCWSAIMLQSRLLHTTSAAHKTRRFYFSTEPKYDAPHGSLRRPQKVRSSLDEFGKRLEMVKQATAFLKNEDAPTQTESPTAPATINLNTSSATCVDSRSATPKFGFFNIDAKDQNSPSDSPYRSKINSTNNFSSERQEWGEHRAVHENHRGNLSERSVRASENRCAELVSRRENHSEHQPERNEGVFEGELSTDRLRFRRRYSRNRLDRETSLTPDLPTNTMEKIKEASHLLTHGTLPLNRSPSLSEQPFKTECRKYFFQDSTPQETTPAVDLDTSTGPPLRRHRGSRATKRLTTLDPFDSLPIPDEPCQARTEGKSPSAPSIKDAFSTINKETNKTPPPTLGSIRGASIAAASSVSSPCPLARSVPLPTPYARQVPRTSADQLQLMKAPVVSPPNSRLLRIALLGLPNSGKSTLVNALLEDRVCSVSNKANTTRCTARAIYTTDDTQLVFLDTPGVVTPEQTIKHRLVGSVVQDAERSLAQADLLLLLHDCTSPFNRLGLHPRLLRMLALYPHIPAMLVMNKVDLVKPKQQLLKMTRLLTEGVVGGRRSHGATPSTAEHRDPFRDVRQDPAALVKHFLDSLELGTPEDEDEKEELQSEDDELPEVNHQMEATQQTQQVSFDHLLSGDGPVVLPCLDTRSQFHVKARVSDEDVLSGRVKLSEQQLASFIEGRRGWPYFKRVLLTSALTGDGVTDLRQVLEDNAVPAPWQFPAAMVTDQDPYQLATLTVREKFMDKFKYQLPYNLRFEVDNWELGDADSLIIRVRVICQETRLVKYLVGADGCHIKALSQLAEQKLGQIFKADVKLQLIVSSEDAKPQQADEPRRNRKKAREQS